MKRMIFWFHPEHFIKLAMQEAFVLSTFPKDTKVVNFGLSESHNLFYVVIESEEFEELKEGDILPTFTITMNKLTPTNKVTTF